MESFQNIPYGFNSIIIVLRTGRQVEWGERKRRSGSSGRIETLGSEKKARKQTLPTQSPSLLIKHRPHTLLS